MEYGEQFQLTFFCHFDFTNFPFDSHECRIEYGDENYGIDDLKLNASTIIYHAYRLFFLSDHSFFHKLECDIYFFFRFTYFLLHQVLCCDTSFCFEQ